MRKVILVAMTVVLLFGFAGTGLSASTEVDALIEKLVEKGILTRTEAIKLKGEIAQDEKTAQEERAKEKPSIRIGTGEARVKGYIQTQFRHFEKEGSNDDFRLRRAYLALEGKVVEDWLYELEVDASASSNILRTVYLRYAGLSPYATLTAGQFKTPLLQEFITSSSAIDTIERSLLTSMADERDVGVMLDGDLFTKRLYYAAGIFRGTGENVSENNDEKDFAGRLVYSPWANLTDTPLAGFGIGASFQTGEQSGSGSTPEYDRDRYGGLLRYELGDFKFQSEFLRENQDKITGNDLSRKGYYLMSTYKFMPKLQGVLKYEHSDPDGSVADDVQEITTTGANWFFNPYVKLMLNYRFRDDEADSSVKDELFGQLQVKF
jgi:phosphate-selective porin